MKSCLVKIAFKHTKKAATDSLHHYPISLKCKTSETVIHNNQSKWSLPASYASSAPQHAGPQLGRAKRTTPKATCGQQNHMIVVELCVSSCKANTTSLHLSQERGGKSTHSYSQSVSSISCSLTFQRKHMLVDGGCVTQFVWASWLKGKWADDMIRIDMLSVYLNASANASTFCNLT